MSVVFVRDQINAGILKGRTVLFAGLHGLFLFDIARFDLFSGWLELFGRLWLRWRDSLGRFVGAHRRGRR